MEYTAEDFKVGDVWNKNDSEWFDVTDVKEFYDTNGSTYIAVGGWYSTNSSYADAYWTLDEFNEWVKDAVKVQEGVRPCIPEYIENKNASAKKSMNDVSFTDMVAKQREKNKKSIKKAYNGDDQLHITYKLTDGTVEDGYFLLKYLLIRLGCEPTKTLNRCTKEMIESDLGYDYSSGPNVERIISIEGLF